jgi:hypothetical protein
LAEFVKRGFVPETTTTTEAPQNTNMYPPLASIQPQLQPQPQPQVEQVHYISEPDSDIKCLKVESEIKDEYSDAALQQHLQEVVSITYTQRYLDIKVGVTNILTYSRKQIRIKSLPTALQPLLPQ